MEFLIDFMPLASSNTVDLQMMIETLIGLFGYLFSLLLMIGVLLGMIAVYILILCGLYAIAQIPIFKMAKNAGLSKPWLAFFPFFGTYVAVSLARKPFDVFNGKYIWDRKKAAKVFILILAADLVIVVGAWLSTVIIPFFGLIFFMFAGILNIAVAVISIIFVIYMNMDIIETYTPNDTSSNKTLWVVLSVVVPIAFIVWLFIHMNDTPNYEYVEYKKNVAARQQQS